MTLAHVRTGFPTRVSGVLVMLICMLSAGMTLAQTPRSLKEAMFGQRSESSRPEVAHFSSEDGESFVMDETSGRTLVRFDGDDEVWLLTPTQGPKGDIIYKNDVGEPVLKATRWGGMTLFSANRPMGDPVAVTGKADSFVPGRISPALLFQTLVRASRRVSLALGHNMIFDAPEVTPGADFLYASAADLTADALIRVSALKSKQKLVAPIRSVEFIEGRPPEVYMDKDVLVLKLDVSRGDWSGRPSSKRISNVIMASFSRGQRR
ncbi:MAG: DUF4908 domain-containing protein [Asticcacaulis sp.]